MTCFVVSCQSEFNKKKVSLKVQLIVRGFKLNNVTIQYAGKHFRKPLDLGSLKGWEKGDTDVENSLLVPYFCVILNQKLIQSKTINL